LQLNIIKTDNYIFFTLFLKMSRYVAAEGFLLFFPKQIVHKSFIYLILFNKNADIQKAVMCLSFWFKNKNKKTSKKVM